MNELVTNENGQLTTTSRVVAEKFGKNHKDVLRAIRNLDCSEEYCRRNFALCFEINGLQNGKKNPYYQMSRDGFIFLATGFTGKEAGQWKEKFITTFNDMEKALEGRMIDPVKALNDPAVMRSLLLNYSEKVLDLEHQVSEMKPQTEAFKRISFADGNMCITDAAKTLQIQPKRLFAYLNENLWIYRRSGNKNWVAYQDRIQTGLLIHKVTTITTSDGEERVHQQVLITPRGLARLSEHFSQVEAA